MVLKGCRYIDISIDITLTKGHALILLLIFWSSSYYAVKYHTKYIGYWTLNKYYYY